MKSIFEKFEHELSISYCLKNIVDFVRCDKGVEVMLIQGFNITEVFLESQGFHLRSLFTDMFKT